MTAREAVYTALWRTGQSQAEIARKIGWTIMQLNGKLMRDTLRAEDFLTIMDAIGIDVTFTLKGTGEVLEPQVSGVGRKVRQMVDGVIYDTSKAYAISNSFWDDGVNKYDKDGRAQELYYDFDGRYFIAEYSTWNSVKDRIVPVTSDEAEKFIQLHGREIHKEPTNDK